MGSNPTRARAIPSGFHGPFHCPFCFPAGQLCLVSPRTVRKLGSNGKRKSTLTGKGGHEPFDSALAWVYRACVSKCQLGLTALNHPPRQCAKKEGDDNSCSNLLVVSVHAHQPCARTHCSICNQTETTSVTWGSGRNTSPSRVLSPSQALLPVVLPVIKRNLQHTAEWCTVINTNSHESPWKGCGSTAQQWYLWA